MMEWWCSGGTNPTQATWMSRHASGYLRPASIRWCLGRGTSVVLARPCTLWTDQAPAVLIVPALGVVDPLWRAHLAECLDEAGVVLAAAVVVAAQDAPHDVPRQLDGLVWRVQVVAV